MTTKNNYKSEAGHWYDHDGKPMYTIVGANGKERNTTLRDAKKENFVDGGLAGENCLIKLEIVRIFIQSLSRSCGNSLISI